MKSTRNGALLASAAAMMFIAGTAMAQGTSSMSGPSAMSAQTAQVKCVGANDCKGHGACKSAQNDCKGQNSCKGKGFIHTASTKECSDKGGKPQAMQRHARPRGSQLARALPSQLRLCGARAVPAKITPRPNAGPPLGFPMGRDDPMRGVR